MSGCASTAGSRLDRFAAILSRLKPGCIRNRVVTRRSSQDRSDERRWAGSASRRSVGRLAACLRERMLLWEIEVEGVVEIR